MTNEEINRAVAESVGWKFIPCHDDGFGRATGERWLDPDGDIGLTPPDYCNDLSAIHEAEQQTFKTREDQMELGMTLLDVCAPGEPVTVVFAIAVIVTATARQRAEAYLRTIGKWRDA